MTVTPITSFPHFFDTVRTQPSSQRTFQPTPLLDTQQPSRVHRLLGRVVQTMQSDQAPVRTSLQRPRCRRTILQRRYRQTGRHQPRGPHYQCESPHSDPPSPFIAPDDTYPRTRYPPSSPSKMGVHLEQQSVQIGRRFLFVLPCVIMVHV